MEREKKKETEEEGTVRWWWRMWRGRGVWGRRRMSMNRCMQKPLGVIWSRVTDTKNEIVPMLSRER
jgi:hypothetical protein